MSAGAGPRRWWRALGDMTRSGSAWTAISWILYDASGATFGGSW